MQDNEPAGATALVTGASRGFGRGIAAALSRAGAQVAGVARDRSPLEELSAELGGSFTAVTADAADLTVAGQLTDAYRPGSPRRVWRLSCLRTATKFTSFQCFRIDFLVHFRRHIAAV